MTRSRSAVKRTQLSALQPPPPQTAVHSRCHSRPFGRKRPAIVCYPFKNKNLDLRTEMAMKRQLFQMLGGKARSSQQRCILKRALLLNYERALSILPANGMTKSLESDDFTSSKIEQPQRLLTSLAEPDFLSREFSASFLT